MVSRSAYHGYHLGVVFRTPLLGSRHDRRLLGRTGIVIRAAVLQRKRVGSHFAGEGIEAGRGQAHHCPTLPR